MKFLKQVHIAIPSRSRFERSLTLESLGLFAKHTTLYVPHEQEKKYTDLVAQHKCDLIATPKGMDGIWPTRQYALDTTDKSKVLFLDDDLQFYFRTKPMGNLLYVPLDEIPDMMEYFLEMMDEYEVPFLGIGLRQYSNVKEKFVLRHQSACNAYLLDVKTLADGGFRVEDFRIQGDFGLILMLLTSGHDTATVYRYVQGQRSSNAPGGCSDYRNEKTMEAGARRLCRLFPQFVTPVTKTTGWKNMPERTDVRIAWKKAYEYGQQKFHARKGKLFFSMKG